MAILTVSKQVQVSDTTIHTAPSNMNSELKGMLMRSASDQDVTLQIVQGSTVVNMITAARLLGLMKPLILHLAGFI